MDENLYDYWNIQKQLIQQQDLGPPYFRQREIWWCSVGQNIGFEQNGKGDLFDRPVLILCKFSQYLFIGIPITHRIKEGPFYSTIDLKGVPNCCLLSQLRLFDSKRLMFKIATLPDLEFQVVRKNLKDLL